MLLNGLSSLGRLFSWVNGLARRHPLISGAVLALPLSRISGFVWYALGLVVAVITGTAIFDAVVRWLLIHFSAYFLAILIGVPLLIAAMPLLRARRGSVTQWAGAAIAGLALLVILGIRLAGLVFALESVVGVPLWAAVIRAIIALALTFFDRYLRNRDRRRAGTGR